MKFSWFILTLFLTIGLSSATLCNKNTDNSNISNKNTMTTTKINIKVGSEIFTATLQGNRSAQAFIDRLPLTIKMTELNGNEKYFDFDESLPANSSNPGTIQNGDLMLYGSNTLVLFYKTFSTSYSYTKLGAVDDPTGLASALGSGTITITYELAY